MLWGWSVKYLIPSYLFAIIKVSFWKRKKKSWHNKHIHMLWKDEGWSFTADLSYFFQNTFHHCRGTFFFCNQMKDVTKHVRIWSCDFDWMFAAQLSEQPCIHQADLFAWSFFPTWIQNKLSQLWKWVDDSIWLCIYNFVCSVNLLCCLFSYHLTLSLRKCPRSSKSHTSSQSRRWFLCAVGFELWPPSPVYAHLPSFPQAWLYWLIEDISAL